MEMAPGLVNGATPYETPVADLAAALFTVIGILAALRARDTRGGRAVSFETSLAQASLALVSAWAPASLSPHGLKRFRSPWYGVYRAGDGVQVAVGALEVWQQDWVIANALGGARPVHRAAVDQDIVAQMMRTRAARDWVRRAASAGVALSIVRQPESVLNDEQVAEILGAGLVPDHPWQRALVPFGPESFPGCVAVEPSEVRSRLLDQLES
jgi:crotonobetainyl-CoA:carnitine CoA-transferase CaiB-like acyl-CoA transferase